MYLNFTDIQFALGSEIDAFGQGVLLWSHDVNTAFIQDNFKELFTVSYKLHKDEAHIKRKIKNLTFEKLLPRAMYFQVEFNNQELVSYNDDDVRDVITFQLKPDLLDAKGYFKPEYRYLDDMFVGNKTLTRMYHQESQKDHECEFECGLNPQNSTDALRPTTYDSFNQTCTKDNCQSGRGKIFG